MPGSGKHTVYYDKAFLSDSQKEKKALLEAVYNKSPFVGGGYDRAVVISVSNTKLMALGSNTESGEEYRQRGDQDHFPADVYFDFRGPEGSSADVSTVAWKKGGDPLNPYVPDIRSPGPAAGTDLTSTDTTNLAVNVDATRGDPRIDSPAGPLTDITTFAKNEPVSNAVGDIAGNAGTLNPIHTGKAVHLAAAGGVDKQLEFGESFARPKV